MIRNLKALGLALVAMFAMSAVVASAASASNQGVLTANEPVTLTGTETGAAQDNRLTAEGAFVQCPGSTYTGHKYDETPHKFIPSGATTATLTPVYKQANENCRGTAGTFATVDMNGCDYVIHLGETTGGVAGTYGTTFDVECPDQKEITVKLWFTENQHTNDPNNPRCVLHVPEQTDLKGAHATDTGNDTIDLTGPVKGITVKQTRNSFLCPNWTHTNTADFDLDVSVVGHNELGEKLPISLSHNT